MADEIELLRRFIDEIPGPSTDAWTRARAAIAAARSEEEPAAPRRRRRRGGKRRVLIAAAGAVAAAVTAFALVLAGSPPPGNSSQVVTTALVTRVEHAVASHQDDMIGYTRIVLRPGSRIQLGTGLMVGGSGAGSSLGVGVMVAWSYQGTTEISAFAPGGQRVFTAETASGGTGKPAQEVAVLYGDATWWRAMLPESNRQARTPPACGRGVVIGPGGWTAALIRSQLSCGSIQAGRQRDYQIGPIAPGRELDGADTVKLTASNGTVLWVNPRTYLPVRVVSGGGELAQIDFRWLPASPVNLARLRMPIPAGFRQIPPPR